jgi:hypothetical protein
VELGAGVSFASLSVSGGGKLDTAADSAAINYGGASPAEVVRGYLFTGRAGGAWTGGGIVSAAAMADPNQVTAVGYAETSQVLGLSGGQVATWEGLAVDATTLLLKYTYYGDLNLDGVVNADDYALMDRGAAGHLTGWVNGDVNYDGVVDARDYLLADRAFVAQGNPLSPEFIADRQARFGDAYVAELVSAVPEPWVAGWSVAGTGVTVGCRRRRRRVVGR